ncbi:MAG: hypothetical protein WA880_02750 [Ornithinimicrobium sp.]
MGMDDLNLGMDEASAKDAELGQEPTLSEANAFMDEREEVHGVGIGATEDGEKCVVLFADRISADAVPASLDGMPVRVHESDSFLAEAQDTQADAD